MKTIILVFFYIIVLVSTGSAQTQLLKVGNAVQYSYESNSYWIILTNKKVNINGKEYFERKNYSPWTNQFSFTKSYERIEEDSSYYFLTESNQDSLIFNFNWGIGKKFFTNTNGNILSGQRIDSIKIADTFLTNDTVYILKNFTYNITTGDTDFNIIPEYNHLSKKIGRLDEGLWNYVTGIKVNGTRYGEVYPYPEEIVFSEDSLYSEFIGDTVNCFLKNTSDFDVMLDSLYTSGLFPYGYLMYLIKDNNYFFINLFNNYPSHPLDTLNYIIPAHDSILLQIYDIDLCAICKKQPNEYFEDTLRFVFSFLSDNEYSFSKSIPISGEGHPSDVPDDKVFPSEYVLEQNYPNPFNPSTTIKYSIPNVISTEGRNLFVNLKVYDVLGNEVATLVNEEKPAGSYNVEFDASKLASGIYFYQLRASDHSTGSGQGFVETKKMILIK